MAERCRQENDCKTSCCPHVSALRLRARSSPNHGIPLNVTEREQAAAQWELFQVISQCYEGGSILLTTNKPLKQWARSALLTLPRFPTAGSHGRQPSTPPAQRPGAIRGVRSLQRPGQEHRRLPQAGGFQIRGLGDQCLRRLPTKYCILRDPFFALVYWILPSICEDTRERTHSLYACKFAPPFILLGHALRRSRP